VLAFRTSLPRRTEIILGMAGLLLFLSLWHLASVSGWVKQQFLPTPFAVVEAFGRLFTERDFAGDILISIGRVWLAFLSGS